MPILHRHVVPNVPALAADNGKIVFRAGKPSHQAPMDFFVEWSGDVGFSAFKSWYDANNTLGYVVAPGQTATAAMINAGWNGGGRIREATAYGNLPVIQAGDYWTRHYAHANDMIEVGYAETAFYIGNDAGQSEFEVAVGIEWDATLTSWRYVAVVGTGGVSDGFRLKAWDPNDQADFGSTRAALYDHPAGGAYDHTLFASPYTTQKLRAGNGVTLTLLHASAADGGWAASDLANCSLIVSAAYA